MKSHCSCCYPACPTPNVEICLPQGWTRPDNTLDGFNTGAFPAWNTYTVPFPENHQVFTEITQTWSIDIEYGRINETVIAQKASGTSWLRSTYKRTGNECSDVELVYEGGSSVKRIHNTTSKRSVS